MTFNRQHRARTWTRLRSLIPAVLFFSLAACSTSPSARDGDTFGTRPDEAAAAGATGPNTRLVLPGLLTAKSAYDQLLRLPANTPAEEREKLFDAYDEGVEAAGRRLLRKMSMPQLVDPLYVRAAEDKTKVYRLNFDRTGRGDPYWEAAYFTEVRFAADVTQNRGSDPQTSDGLGVPVVLMREYTEEAGQNNPTLPLNGIHQPATVILEFSGKTDAQGVEDVAVRLYDSRGIETVQIGGRRYKPAEDLSAAIALSMRAHFWFRFAWKGFFNPRDQVKDQGLYAIQRYDPHRIPIVFVHGLRSDPHIWKNAMNAILADRELAKRYQIWYYLYPTGLPITSAAAEFRKSLYTTREHFDSEGDDPGFNQTLLVGHSMGGLLARLQSTESGMDFWYSNFKKPPGHLGLWRTDEKLLEKALIFEPVHFVARNVYIATPHRGSKMATWTLVDWMLSFVRRPQGLVNIATNMLTMNTDALQPELANFKRMGTTGVDSLSPDYPFFAALDEKSITVPYHSIMASLTGKSNMKSTDGVVPYSSSHLAGAESELVIPGWHGCVERDETVLEIIRIMRLHAGMPPPPPVPEPETKPNEGVKPVTPETHVMAISVSDTPQEKPAPPKRKPRSARIYKR